MIRIPQFYHHLTEQDLGLAWELTRQRTFPNILTARPRVALGGSEQDTWLWRLVRDLEGILGELVVCFYLGVFPKLQAPVDQEPDIDPDIEVRTTSYSTGHLLIREDDNPSRRFVLALVQPPLVTLAGWCWGHEVVDIPLTRVNEKVERLARKVPQNRLGSMALLKSDSVRQTDQLEMALA